MTALKQIIKTERIYENFLISNIERLCTECGWGDIQRFENQFTIPLNKGKIVSDVMIWHKDGTGTCIEIKTGKNNRNDDITGVSQLLFYGAMMEKRLTNMPRLVLVMPKIKPEVFEIIKRFKLPVNLLELTDDKCIYITRGNIEKTK